MATSKNPKTKKGARRKNILFLILILLLLGGNGFLVWYNLQTEEARQQTEAELEEAIEERVKLEQDIETMEAELEAYKGRNAELDSLLAQAERDLQEARTLKDQAESRAATYRHQRNQLRQLKAQYLAKIDSLEQANKQLTAQNVKLEENLKSESDRRQELEGETSRLGEKVELGSVLLATDIEGIGERERGSGSYKETDNASRVDRLKVCFNIEQNLVVDPGEEMVLVRIIGPDGSTLSVESMGSGTFKMAETSEVRQYTVKKEFTYNNKQKQLCVYWQQNLEFPEGNYTVEVYNKGYKIGNTSFELGKGFLGIF